MNLESGKILTGDESRGAAALVTPEIRHGQTDKVTTY